MQRNQLKWTIGYCNGSGAISMEEILWYPTKLPLLFDLNKGCLKLLSILSLGEGLDHMGSILCNLSLHCKGFFCDLNL